MSKILDKSYSIQVLSKTSMWEHTFGNVAGSNPIDSRSLIITKNLTTQIGLIMKNIARNLF